MTFSKGQEVAGIPRRGQPAGGVNGSIRGAMRPRVVADSLYGEVRVAGWAAALLTTPPFQRLDGVSLSDVPGKLLFDRPFPSRLDHALGVYHLARLARPRDRALQAAALAHDLGHGPFSHLTEPLMRERLGEDHETRSVGLLAEVRRALPAAAAKQLTWLDWDEVAQLVTGSADGRGALLNGRLDLDNADNVARFLLTSGLASPTYDPQTLVRGLRPLPPSFAATATGDLVVLQAAVEREALSWQADRTRLYHFLHEGHTNLAAHAMLRKAVDLGAAMDILPPDFFDLTDMWALRLLGQASHRGLAALVARVRTGAGRHHRCVWEAEVPPTARAIPALMSGWRERLALEEQLAAEAALALHEVIVEAVVSRAQRALPPVAQPSRSGAFIRQPEPFPAPRVVHIFVPCDAHPDYVRRLRLAAERLFCPLGAAPREEVVNDV